MAKFTAPIGDSANVCVTSKFSVAWLNPSFPASKVVGLAAPSDVLMEFSTPKPKLLPPYTPPRSQFQSLQLPRAPTAPEASTMSLVIRGRNPLGYLDRTVRSSDERRKNPAASPSRWL